MDEKTVNIDEFDLFNGLNSFFFENLKTKIIILYYLFKIITFINI